MKKIICLCYLLFATAQTFAQNNASLRKEFHRILATKKATVGVAVQNLTTGDTLSLNGHKAFPLLSVFKFPVALAVLNKVDKGELSLSQKLFISQKELLPDTYSPFREQYPNGNLSISLKEALEWMVTLSDNNLCDILIKLVGGETVIEKYLNNPDIIIRNNEEAMHQNWEAQFVNTITPLASNALLKPFFEGNLLTPQSTTFLYQTMVATPVGAKRIKGKLPAQTVVAHRTGSSFTNEAGLTGAINDIGIVPLPDGSFMLISVFVHNTTEPYQKGEALIADLTKAAWDYYAAK